jgi:hypothetical protein
LRKLPQFVLIGESIKPEHLLSTFKTLDEEEFFVSGDFKSATDLLNINITLTIANEVIRKAFPTCYGDERNLWRELIMKELGP